MHPLESRTGGGGQGGSSGGGMNHPSKTDEGDISVRVHRTETGRVKQRRGGHAPRVWSQGA